VFLKTCKLLYKTPLPLITVENNKQNLGAMGNFQSIKDKVCLKLGFKCKCEYCERMSRLKLAADEDCILYNTQRMPPRLQYDQID
jgi:hypothetical protein